MTKGNIIRDLIKAKLTIAVIALVTININQSTRIDDLEAAMAGPDSWQVGISQMYDSTDWGAARKHFGEHILTVRDSGCELHRVKWRSVYYMMNTCGGIAPEFQGLDAPALHVPSQVSTVVPSEKFGSNL